MRCDSLKNIYISIQWSDGIVDDMPRLQRKGCCGQCWNENADLRVCSDDGVYNF
nr:MAG TPA: hypothetical protein [Caudoviricetes sp.]